MRKHLRLASIVLLVVAGFAAVLGGAIIPRAHAATLSVLNSSGQIVNMNGMTDTGGAFSPRNIWCDGNNPDQCASVNASGQASVLAWQPTAANLNATVVQGNAAALLATVVQATGNNLHTVVDSCNGCGGTITAGQADESPFVAGTTPQLLAGCFYQTTATSNPLTNGIQGAIQCTAQRGVFSNLRDSSGNEEGTSGNPLQVSIANTGANGTAIVATDTLNQGGSVLSVTNGIYANILQGNAVNSAGNPLFVTTVPLTSGGTSPISRIVANNTTSVAVGSSAAHQLYGIDAFSVSASTPVYVKLYNATQGSTTCGSGTPVARYVIPASGGAAGSGYIMHEPNGVAFSTALTYCVTGGFADNDTTAPAASSYIVNFYVK